MSENPTTSAGLRDFPCCEAYLISQNRADPDTVPLGGVGLTITDAKPGSPSNTAETT
jgi:hypothetical protein